MDIALFILSSLGFAMIPGPNAALIIATTLAHNLRKSVQTVLGINIGILVQLLIALISTRWLLSKITDSINWFIFSLSAIFIYLILRWIFSRFRSEPKPNLSGAMSFSRALGLSLTNPKGLIFYALILPPFIDKAGNIQMQSAAFSALFLVLCICVDIFYVCFAKKLSKLLHHTRIRRFLIKHRRLTKYRFKSWLGTL